MNNPKPNKKGPEPERLIIESGWEQAVGKAIKAKPMPKPKKSKKATRNSK